MDWENLLALITAVGSGRLPRLDASFNPERF
jgi:hypothetical protein